MPTIASAGALAVQGSRPSSCPGKQETPEHRDWLIRSIQSVHRMARVRCFEGHEAGIGNRPLGQSHAVGSRCEWCKLEFLGVQLGPWRHKSLFDPDSTQSTRLAQLHQILLTLPGTTLLKWQHPARECTPLHT